MEADLAANYHGVDGDLRNLWRRGSGLTLRRLSVLLSGLPPGSRVDVAIERAHQKALTGPDRQRERMEHYKSKGGGA